MSGQKTGRGQGIGPASDSGNPMPGNWAARHELLLYFPLAFVVS
jgi:hypothetical protein